VFLESTPIFLMTMEYEFTSLFTLQTTEQMSNSDNVDNIVDFVAFDDAEG
jgi:hypothetical protein